VMGINSVIFHPFLQNVQKHLYKVKYFL